jgi:hypothetical protein
MGAESRGKTLTYSALADKDNVIPECKELKKSYGEFIMQSTGTGQFLLLFPPGLQPLNVVMKAVEAQLVNQPYEYPVADLVKHSDSASKAIGKPEAIQAVRDELKNRYGILV